MELQDSAFFQILYHEYIKTSQCVTIQSNPLFIYLYIIFLSIDF